MKTKPRAPRVAYRLFTVVLAVFCFCITSQAQRTMRDQNLLTANTQIPCAAISGFGAEFSYGRYLLDGYWKSSASIVPRGLRLSTGDHMDLLTIRAGADYMFRIASVRSRVFGLYGGGGAFIGYELYDPNSRLPSNIYTGLGNGTFIYGVTANLETEIFIINNIALTTGFSMPLTFGSVAQWLRANAHIGFRINL